MKLLATYILTLAMLLELPGVSDVSAQTNAGQGAAQSAIISGTVVDAKTREPVVGAIVALRTAAGKNLKFGTSNAQGRFSLKVNAPSSAGSSGRAILNAGDSLRVTMLGYKTSVILPETGKENRIELQPEALNIKEVYVRAPKVAMEGDTIKFAAKTFTDLDDKTLADIMKKMPGIEVAKDGTVKYNGKEIGNFYIEGIDMLGANYNLATKNISAKDVRRVDVIEGHQDKKVLQGLAHTEQASINIKLDESAKAKWIWNGGIAAGYSDAPAEGLDSQSLLAKDSASRPYPLLNGRLFGMRIGRGAQRMLLAKADNTGENLGYEVGMYSASDFYDRPDYKIGDMVGTGASAAPLEENRTRFNNSIALNSTSSRNLKDDRMLNSQVCYIYDRLSSFNQSSTTYHFLNDSSSTVTETQRSRSSQHKLNGSISISVNKDKYYFRDCVSGSAAWNSAATDVTGSFPNRGSSFTPSFEASNYLEYNRRKDRRLFTITSFNKFISKPQSLAIERPEIWQTQKQDVDISAFYSTNSTSYSKRFDSGWTAAVSGSLAGLYRRMDSNLSGLDTTGFSLIGASYDNHLSIGYLRLSANPQLSYDSQVLYLSASLPISYSQYFLKGQGANATGGSSSTLGLLQGKASLYAKYSFTPQFNATLSADAGSGGLDEGSLYGGYILQNYRVLLTGSFNRKQNLSFSLYGALNYKNPMDGWFLTASCSYSRNLLQNLASQWFLGSYIVSGSVPSANGSSVLSASLEGTKSLFKINGLVGVKVSCSDFATQMQQNGTLTPYGSQGISVSPRFNGRFLRWLLAEYEMEFTHSVMSISGEKGASKDNYRQNLTLKLSPLKRLSINLAGEHYHTQLTDNASKDMFIADIIASYSLNSSVDLKISITNLLDAKVYAYSVYSGLSDFTCTYAIRPRNILLGAYWQF